MINGDKSQDIGDAERRSLIEIKEAIVRVQTAPAMDIIAKEDLADKNVQKELGVEIEKFDPNDPTLSEKVRERLNELKAEGKEIVAFYDKKTGKIFINQNAKDEEVRASIAREYKIKEDLELGRGKANDKGQLRSTVAGEIAYDEIKNRLKKGDKNPISASRFDVAKMDKDSEVTSDKYGEQVEGFENIAGGAIKLNAVTSEVDMNPGILDEDPEARKRLYQAGKEFNETYNKNVDYMIEGWHRPEVAKREALILEKEIVKEKDPVMKNLLIARHGYLEREAHPLNSMGKSLFKGGVKGFVTTITIRLASKTAVGKVATLVVIGGKIIADGINGAREVPKIPITSKQVNNIKRVAPEFYKSAEGLFTIKEKSNTSNTSLLRMAEDYYRNSQTPDERLANDVGYVAGGYAASKGMDIAESKYNSLKTLTSDPNLVSANEVTNGEQLLLENKVNSVQGKVFINDGTPGGTTIAHQIRTTYSSGSMSILQNNLTTGEISLQKINPSGQLIYEKSFTPYQLNALIGANSSSQMLVGNGAVSQGASKLPYKSVLALPVKYPIKSESGVTLYQGYAIGIRGGEYKEAGITKDNKIAYRNNGSYYVVGQGDDGFKNIPATDVTTNYLISEPGGRKGSPETRAQINAIIKVAKDEDWIHVAGGEKSEEYLSASKLVNKSTKDSNYIDITLQKNIKGKEVIVRINTVDIYKNGNLTKREAEAARLINLKIIREGEGNPQLITIPKGQGTGNIEKILKKIEADIEKDTK